MAALFKNDPLTDKHCRVVYEIPGGLLFGSRIDIRAKPSEQFRKFSVSLLGDVEGTRNGGIALSFEFDAIESRITLVSIVDGDERERSTSVDIDLFAEKYFVFSIHTLPLQYRIFVDDILLTELVHRMDVHRVEFLRIQGDLLIFCVEMSDNFSHQQLLPVGRDLLYSPRRQRKRDQLLERGLDEQTIRKQTLEILPEEYKGVIDDMDRASVSLDEEIDRLSRTSDMELEHHDGISLKSSAKSSDAEESAREHGKQGQPREAGEMPVKLRKTSKRNFKRFLGKFSKSARKTEEISPQVHRKEYAVDNTGFKPSPTVNRELKTIAIKKPISDSEDLSDFSTDMENYLQKTDSELDGYESPSQLLKELEEIANASAKHIGGGNVGVAVPRRKTLEHGDRDSGVSVDTQTKLNVIGADQSEEKLHSLMTSALSAMNRNSAACAYHEDTTRSDGKVSFHVIHHHVHHNAGILTEVNQPTSREVEWQAKETDKILETWKRSTTKKDANIMTVKQTIFQRCFWCCYS
ncbi:uncharacterized protein LOC141913650 [Tubulanus polymorphus]|uniref:uncharacterized protein LOC141913650 n=1 Tax=Tubulanus polymorphus TaxID=672921 RepID=UPI003DA20332